MTSICPNCKGTITMTSSNVGVRVASAQIQCVKPQVGSESYCGMTWFLHTTNSF